MNSVCLFASYYTADNIPDHIQIYLRELRKYFSELVLLTVKQPSTKDLEFLHSINVGHQVEKNEGFDFGMWYKAFQKTNLLNYDQIAMVNDSCVLFKPLDLFFAWATKDKADVKGMTLSEAITPHIQSYFMVLNKKAIVLTASYFERHGIQSAIEDVIKVYELGLNKYFADNGLTLSAFVDNGDYKGEFAPYYRCVDHHLQQGIPLIKKKILFSSYREDELPNLARMGFDIRVEHYYEFIANQKNTLFNVNAFKKEHPPQMNSGAVFFYNVRRILIKIFRPLYKSITK